MTRYRPGLRVYAHLLPWYATRMSTNEPTIPAPINPERSLAFFRQLWDVGRSGF